MEYADGGTLDEALKARALASRPLDEDFLMDWFCQIVSALAYMHAHCILHRDLKSANVFLTVRNLVKVGDFGISTELAATGDLAQTAIGTPYYLAPELINGEGYEYKADVWALGVLLYEMAALRRPFEASTLPALALRIVRVDYAPPPADYSAELRALIGSVLQREPERRPAIAQIAATPLVRRHHTKIQAQLRSLALLALPELSTPAAAAPPPRATATAAATAAAAAAASGAASGGMPPADKAATSWACAPSSCPAPALGTTAVAGGAPQRDTEEGGGAAAAGADVAAAVAPVPPAATSPAADAVGQRGRAAACALRMASMLSETTSPAASSAPRSEGQPPAEATSSATAPNAPAVPVVPGGESGGDSGGAGGKPSASLPASGHRSTPVRSARGGGGRGGRDGGVGGVGGDDGVSVGSPRHAQSHNVHVCSGSGQAGSGLVAEAGSGLVAEAGSGLVAENMRFSSNLAALEVNLLSLEQAGEPLPQLPQHVTRGRRSREGGSALRSPLRSPLCSPFSPQTVPTASSPAAPPSLVGPSFASPPTTPLGARHAANQPPSSVEVRKTKRCMLESPPSAGRG